MAMTYRYGGKKNVNAYEESRVCTDARWAMHHYGFGKLSRMRSFRGKAVPARQDGRIACRFRTGHA
jgi:hypothetical protein